MTGFKKKQNPLQHLELHPDRFGGNDNRLSVLVTSDFLGEVALDAERSLQDAAEFARVALERGAFKPADQFAGDRHDAASRLAGSDIKIDEDEPAFFRRGRKEKVCEIALARFSVRCRGGRSHPCELFENGLRSARVARQCRRNDAPRLRVDDLDEPKRQLDKLGYLLGTVIGFLDVKVGDNAQQGRRISTPSRHARSTRLSNGLDAEGLTITTYATEPRNGAHISLPALADR